MTDNGDYSKGKKIQEAQEYYDKGLVYGQEGDADGAIECWQKTVDLNPDHFDGWYNLGNAYHIGKGDIEKAVECWNKALELKPDNIDVLYNMGNAYRENREFDRAIEIYRKVVELDPKDHEDGIIWVILILLKVSRINQ